MANVISLPTRRQSAERGLACLSHVFANRRRARGDVFWLKENAEWLGLLSTLYRPADAETLAPYESFFSTIPRQLTFFPQYYRFFLSLYLDLEDLGMTGHGEALCDWVRRQNLAGAELSDLQRAEALRLLARRGQGDRDPSLSDRLRAFMSRAETFALPNKKAAYELAHIVFYLSDYGAVDPDIGQAAQRSLSNAGILAYLDQDADLLAEICIAQRFCGVTPPPVWEALVIDTHRHCRLGPAAHTGAPDGYHCFLVTGQLARLSGAKAFDQTIAGEGPVCMTPPARREGVLRDLSEGLYDLGLARSAGWNRMRTHLLPTLGDQGRVVLEEAETSTDRFGAFFESFARAGEGGIGLM